MRLALEQTTITWQRFPSQSVHDLETRVLGDEKYGVEAGKSKGVLVIQQRVCLGQVEPRPGIKQIQHQACSDLRDSSYPFPLMRMRDRPYDL